VRKVDGPPGGTHFYAACTGIMRSVLTDFAAKALDILVETVDRDWKLAKVWLLRELSEESEEQDHGA
jgi:hypothetical protein